MTDIRHILRSMSATTTLIAINVVVMLLVFVVTVILKSTGSAISPAVAWLDLPGGLGFVSRPWTLLTYMFTQTDVWHCIFNMLWLYWFGMMLESVTSGKTVVKAYVAGGFAGAVVYVILTCVLNGVNSPGCLEGASAAVMGIVAMMACKEPDVKLNLLLLGRIKIKWVALVTLIIFACGLMGAGLLTNAAHIAGFAAGAVYGLLTRYKGRYSVDATEFIGEQQARARLDALLDKVRRSGYASLSASERRELFELSHRV